MVCLLEEGERYSSGDGSLTPITVWGLAFTAIEADPSVKVLV
jgi:hypothetical protein